MLCLTAIFMLNVLTSFQTREFRRYVSVFPQNRDDKEFDMMLILASSRPNTVTVEVHIPYLNITSSYLSLTLTPGQKEEVTLPTDIQMPVGTLTSNRIITVIADDDITVLVFSVEGSNSDMYQVRETLQLGREYVVVVGETNSDDGGNTIAIVSPYTDANVKVILPAFISSISAEIDGVSEDLQGEFSLTLKENQTFQIQSQSDLTGTYIQSDLPIAVIGGINRTQSEEGDVCSDGQLSQMMEIREIGSQYIVFGFPDSNTEAYVHVVSTISSTEVSFKGNTETIDLARESRVFNIDGNEFNLLETSSPAVVAVSTESDKGGIKLGDPSLYMIQPLPLRGLKYTVPIPDDRLDSVYVIIMVDNDDVDGVLLNGVLVTDVVWQEVEGSSILACYYSVADDIDLLTIRHQYGKPLAVYMHEFKHCAARAFLLVADEEYTINPECADHTHEIRRDLISHSEKRVTSKRMKLLVVEDSNQCFLHCVKYEECIGVNFSTQVNSWEVNCQLVFTQTDGQEDTPDWTYYQLSHN